VQEISDDLGLKADDIPGMVARLRAQNTNVSSISLFGSDNVDSGKAVRPNTAPQRLVQSSNRPASAAERKSGNATFRSSFTLGFDEPVKSSANSNGTNSNNSTASSNKKVANLAAVMQQQPVAAPAAGTSRSSSTAAGGTSLANLMSHGNNPAAAPIQDARVADLMERLRANLIGRGAAGIIGIQRKFRIIDDDNSKSLNLGEFTKALRETGLNFSSEEILLLFKYFDVDRNGSIDFEEFLQKLRVRDSASCCIDEYGNLMCVVTSFIQ
jgi:hypothetical protein